MVHSTANSRNGTFHNFISLKVHDCFPIIHFFVSISKMGQHKILNGFEIHESQTEVKYMYGKENMTERPVPTSAEHSMCRSVADLVQCLLFLSSSRSNAPSLHLTSSSLVQVESGKREVWGFSIPRAILNTLHHLDQLDLYPATCITSDPKNKPKTLLSGSIFWAPSLRESTNFD